MSIAKTSGITKFLLFATGSGLVIILGTLLTINKNSDRLFKTIENILQPQPTELQIEESALLLKQIQKMQQLTTTTYNMETIVPTSADRTWGENWTIGTTKLLYLAKGEVKAGIDLSQLTKEDVDVSKNKIAIVLPAAEILDSKIDVSNSRVYHYDRGFLNLGPDIAPQLQTLAQQKTLNKIVVSACDEGILKTASEEGQRAIAHFLDMISDKEVEVIIDDNIDRICISNK